MLGQCWAIVYDAGPTLNKHWVNVSWSNAEDAQTRHAHLHDTALAALSLG